MTLEQIEERLALIDSLTGLAQSFEITNLIAALADIPDSPAMLAFAIESSSHGDVH